MPKILSEEAVEQFHNQGFLAPIPVLNPEEVAYFRASLEACERKHPDDLAKLKTKSHLIGAIPIVENMPSGKATRPGDIVRSYAGKTIEIGNTDAGRNPNTRRS